MKNEFRIDSPGDWDTSETLLVQFVNNLIK